ncbi:hypothetical protein DRN43_00635 [Thermococci archaeon]|nr:MAG: hypothetical protein DRN43_00635 [Thermococci archaeon]
MSQEEGAGVPPESGTQSVKNVFIAAKWLYDVKYVYESEKYLTYYTPIPRVLLKIEKPSLDKEPIRRVTFTREIVLTAKKDLIALCRTKLLFLKGETREKLLQEFIEVLRKVKDVPNVPVLRMSDEDKEKLGSLSAFAEKIGVSTSPRIQKLVIFLRIPEQTPKDAEILQVSSLREIVEALEARGLV